MFDRVIGLAIIAGISCFAVVAAADGPSTAPAANAADTQSLIQADLLRLSDRDPAVRDSAREQLMGLPPTDLPALRTAVEQMRPLPPGYADALHEIVTQVYLAGENTDGLFNKGFMGILMDDSVHADDEGDSDSSLGVVVEMRLPGFDAYRVLRDGDIILSISTDDIDAMPVHEAAEIHSTVERMVAGQHVRLEIIRHGRRMETTVVLSPRPRELESNQPGLTPADYRRALVEKAQAFWLARFAPVVDESIS